MDLSHVLGELPKNQHPDVLADFEDASDAGVYRLGDGLAIVQTVDFFTPIVNEPDIFGGVAAAHALSDLYTMGAEPLTALAIAGFPKKGLDIEVLGAIFKGGHRKLTEAGAVLLGGHTVQDDEIKFGYAVTGRIHPGKLITNAGVRPNDLLYLTKPIGTGVLATALKKGKLSEMEVAELHRSMLTLNRLASEAMMVAGASAATDVSGFGLLGHAGEMARASGVALELEASSVPFLSGAMHFQSKDYVTGALETNRSYVSAMLDVDGDVPSDVQELLLDPQTSGGLLIAVHPDREGALLEAMAARNVTAARVGRATEGPPWLRVHQRILG